MADGNGIVSVSQRIEAEAGDLFRVLADPRRHPEIDGSGMVRGAVTDEVVRGVGDIFVMQMYFEPIGDYQMNNHVVAFEPDRLLAWEPEAGRGHPEGGEPGAGTGLNWGHRWIYRLEPDGPGATLVTESYDCTRAPAEARARMNDGRQWLDGMTATLQRLAELSTGRPMGEAVEQGERGMVG